MRPERIAAALCVALGMGCSTSPATVERTAPEPARAPSCEDDSDCDDGLICSGLERCLDGRCWSGRPLRCDDGDACTEDLCLEPLGCRYAPIDAACQGPPSAGFEDAALPIASPDAGARSDAGYQPRKPDYCDGSLIEGDVTVSQPETLQKLAGVRCIDGNLTLSGLALTSLEPLASLRWVGKDLALSELGALRDLVGLDALERVDGGLSLTGLHDVVSLRGFASLREVLNDVRVLRANRLRELAGFPALTRIGGSLLLDQLPALEELSLAFAALEELGESLTLKGAPQLMGMNAFNALRRVGGALLLELKAQTLSGFDVLEEVGAGLTPPSSLRAMSAFGRLRRSGALSLQFQALHSFTGFPRLEEVDQLLEIGGAALEELAGFERLQRAGGLSLGPAPRLHDVRAFQALEALDSWGKLALEETQLARLALPRLVRAKVLLLQRNPALVELSLAPGFGSAEPLGVSILENPELTALPFLDEVRELQRLTLHKNRTLTRLGLSRVESGQDTFDVRANPALSRCEVDALQARWTQRPDFPARSACNRGCADCAQGVCRGGDGVVTAAYGDCGMAYDSAADDVRVFAAAYALDGVRLVSDIPARIDLSRLKLVRGELTVVPAAAENLGMFSGLEEVTGSLTLSGAARIDFTPLSQLRRVGQALFVSGLSEPSALLLPALTFVGTSIRIQGSAAMATCEIEQLKGQLSAQSPLPTFDVQVIAPCTGSCVGPVCQ
jgi:hypothetical protein